MSPDLINGLFELLGGIAVWANVRVILRDRHYAGFSPWTTVFFSGWGLWNCFYYPHLGQWWSFAGGLFICTGNFVYILCLYIFAPTPVQSRPHFRGD